MPNPDPTPNPRQQAHTHRVAGVMLFVAACLMAVGGIFSDNPFLLVGAGCELIAWFCLVTTANRLEGAEDNAS